MIERLDGGAAYFIVAADIDRFPEVTLLERRELVISTFRDEIEAFYKKSELTPPKEYKDDDKYIVLWRNLPKTNIPNNTEDALFGTMCRNEYDKSRIRLADQGIRYIMPFLINVRDTETFADGSIETFIKRYCAVKKYFSTQPLVYDLDVIPDSRKSFGEIQHIQDNPPERSITDDMTEEEKEAAYRKNSEDNFNYFDMLEDIDEKWLKTSQEDRKQADAIISFLTKLYSAVANNSIEYEECPFIHYYYLWQMGKISAEAACQELDNMSKRTFYKYQTEFEAHPYFGEYEKIYYSEIWNTPKKGPLSFDLEQFYTDYVQLNSNEDFIVEYRPVIEGEIEKSDFTAAYKLCEKYSIPTVLELQRTFLAVKKKLKK